MGVCASVNGRQQGLQKQVSKVKDRTRFVSLLGGGIVTCSPSGIVYLRKDMDNTMFSRQMWKLVPTTKKKDKYIIVFLKDLHKSQVLTADFTNNKLKISEYKGTPNQKFIVSFDQTKKGRVIIRCSSQKLYVTSCVTCTGDADLSLEPSKLEGQQFQSILNEGIPLLQRLQEAVKQVIKQNKENRGKAPRNNDDLSNVIKHEVLKVSKRRTTKKRVTFTAPKAPIVRFRDAAQQILNKIKEAKEKKIELDFQDSGRGFIDSMTLSKPKSMVVSQSLGDEALDTEHQQQNNNKQAAKPILNKGPSLSFSIQACHSGKAIAISKINADGATTWPIVQEDSTDSVREKWIMMPFEDNQWAFLAFKSPTGQGTYCMQVEFGMGSGARVVCAPFLSKDNQKFYTQKFDDGSFKITPAHSMMCLEIASQGNNDGDALVQGNFTDGYHQKFRINVG